MAIPDLKVTRGGKTVSLFVNQNDMEHSRHAKTACVQCHTGGDPSATRACSTMTAKVDCSICHAEVVDQYKESRHGTLRRRAVRTLRAATTATTPHKILSKKDSNSPTFSRNIPALCANCHRTGQKAALRYQGKQHNIVENYMESIHGRGLMQAGLTVTANCADCHSAAPRSCRHPIRAPA